MLNTTTKLHMLLLFTIVAVALYMFFLYKEIKSFQDDIVVMKKQIQGILQGGGSENVKSVTPSLEQQPKQKPDNFTVDKDVGDNLKNKDMDHDDEDSESVHSDDIKNILTNIQDIEESDDDNNVEDVADVDTPMKEQDIAAPENQEECIEAAPIISNSITILEDDIIAFTGKHTVEQDLSLLSDEELDKIKYDDLRGFLRKRGIAAKGNKKEVIKTIKELKGL